MVAYDAVVGSSALRDLMIRVDTSSGQILCAAPGSGSDVETFEPAPGTPPLPTTED